MATPTEIFTRLEDLENLVKELQAKIEKLEQKTTTEIKKKR